MKNELDDLANIFKVLGYRKRLEILLVLYKKGPITVTDIVDELNENIWTVSRHLRDLNKTGLVTYSNKGRNVLYRIKRHRLAIRNDMLLFLILDSFNRHKNSKDTHVVNGIMLGDFRSFFKKYLH